jgi:uridine kinase
MMVPFLSSAIGSSRTQPYTRSPRIRHPADQVTRNVRTRLAPSVPAFDGTGRIFNFNDCASIDPHRVEAAIARHEAAAVIVVEGIFALALDCVRDRARWSAYVDAPADIRIASKTLRKLDEGRAPRHVLRGYLEQGRRAHERHVAPTRLRADLVLVPGRPVRGGERT